MDKQAVIEEMKVLPTIDVAYEVTRRVGFIKQQLKQSGMNALVLGISGGIDSCTLGRLAQLAIDELNQEHHEKYQFVAVRLPYNVQADEEDAQASIDFIKPTQSIAVNVQPGADAIHQETCSALTAAGLLPTDESKQDFVKGNVKARTRMVIQYEIAGMVDGLVLGGGGSWAADGGGDESRARRPPSGSARARAAARTGTRPGMPRRPPTAPPRRPCTPSGGGLPD